MKNLLLFICILALSTQAAADNDTMRDLSEVSAGALGALLLTPLGPAGVAVGAVAGWAGARGLNKAGDNYVDKK